ncbi:hypothetical protein CCACVL1_19660 [Corchorus capsularis]|uniref:Uncharacterized protein n=1 Tax=Corchorus capsularis TaxID=210143 RepID=A0A1R3HFK3_COCAP|nr:hypothetical protein CCACVL1_19660 [Corchorus capsularis]
MSSSLARGVAWAKRLVILKVSHPPQVPKEIVECHTYG